VSKALVTGGTRGIGRAVATALLEAGHTVFVTGTSPEGPAPDGCGYFQCDFEDSEQLQSFAEELVGLDLSILVNNAGINKIGPLAEYSLSDFERIQQVNVTAPFLLCRAVIPGMQSRAFGRIVNITSIFGVVSKSERSAYSTSKFGLFGMSRALALEVAAKNIMVNCVAPGFVDTDLTRRVLGEEGIAAAEGQIPVRRLARPEEIAHCVRFLVSDENSYLTGQNVVVDGGFTSV